MINFGSSKLGDRMPKGSKTEETNDNIPRLVTGLNVNVSWLIFQIIPRAFSEDVYQGESYCLVMCSDI